MVWLNLCAQLVEAIRPMYYIMISKALLSQSVSTEPDPQLGHEGHDHVRVQTVSFLAFMKFIYSGFLSAVGDDSLEPAVGESQLENRLKV